MLTAIGDRGHPVSGSETFHLVWHDIAGAHGVMSKSKGYLYFAVGDYDSLDQRPQGA